MANLQCTCACAPPVCAQRSRVGMRAIKVQRAASELTDDALMREAVECRRQALQGQRTSFGRAHELEKELQRRGLITSARTPCASLKDDSTLGTLPDLVRRPWWRFWGGGVGS